MRNQPDLCSGVFFDNVMAAENHAGQVECTFAIPESSCPMIVRGSVSSGQCFDGRAERVSWSIVARYLRHINLHIKLIRTPIFRKVGLAARRDLNSGETLSQILSTCVEGATRVVRLVVLTVIKFNDVFLNNQFK
jgi:hypothetical protein